LAVLVLKRIVPSIFNKDLINSGQTGYAMRYLPKVENCEIASSETIISGKNVYLLGKKPRWLNLTLESVPGKKL